MSESHVIGEACEGAVAWRCWDDANDDETDAVVVWSMSERPRDAAEMFAEFAFEQDQFDSIEVNVRRNDSPDADVSRFIVDAEAEVTFSVMAVRR